MEVRKPCRTDVLVEFLLLADEVRHEADIAFSVLLEGKAGIQFKSLAAELGRHFHQIGLAVVEHLGKVAGLFKVVTFHAPFLFQLLPVDFALVNGLVASSALRLLLRVFLILFLLLFHFFLFLDFFGLLLLFLIRLLPLSGGLFFLYLLLVAGSVHLVGRKQFLIGFGVFQQVFHHLHQFVGLVCRDTVETEAAGFLALPEEVFEEVVQHVSVPVEWCGEDWDGFVEALDDYPQLLGLDRIRELIAKYPGNRGISQSVRAYSH